MHFGHGVRCSNRNLTRTDSKSMILRFILYEHILMVTVPITHGNCALLKKNLPMRALLTEKAKRNKKEKETKEKKKLTTAKTSLRMIMFLK